MNVICNFHTHKKEKRQMRRGVNDGDVRREVPSRTCHCEGEGDGERTSKVGGCGCGPGSPPSSSSGSQGCRAGAAVTENVWVGRI